MRLLAGAARVRGASSYQAPSADLTAMLAEEPEGQVTGLSRETEVMAFISATGGG